MVSVPHHEKELTGIMFKLATAAALTIAATLLAGCTSQPAPAASQATTSTAASTSTAATPAIAETPAELTVDGLLVKDPKADPIFAEAVNALYKRAQAEGYTEAATSTNIEPSAVTELLAFDPSQPADHQVVTSNNTRPIKQAVITGGIDTATGYWTGFLARLNKGLADKTVTVTTMNALENGALPHLAKFSDGSRYAIWITPDTKQIKKIEYYTDVFAMAITITPGVSAEAKALFTQLSGQNPVAPLK